MSRCNQWSENQAVKDLLGELCRSAHADLEILGDGVDSTLVADGLLKPDIERAVASIGGQVPVANLVIFDLDARPDDLSVVIGLGPTNLGDGVSD